MYCYYCGKQINDDASFCRFCGMPASVPTEQAVSADRTDPKGHPRLVGLILGIAICAALVAVFLVTGIAHINLPGSAVSSEHKVEGAGFDSPEEAITGYLEALQTGNLDHILSTFAVESYCENYNIEKRIEMDGVYNFSSLLGGNGDRSLVACGENEPLRDIMLNLRQSDITQQLYRQVLQLYGNFDEIVADGLTVTEESDIQGVIAALSNLSEELDLSTLEIGEVIYSETMSQHTSFDTLLSRMKKYGDVIGAEGFKSLGISFSLKGEYGLLFMDIAKIGGKWYNVRPGGFLSVLAGMDTYHGGMLYGDDDSLPEALGQGGMSASEALSDVYAYQDNVILEMKWEFAEASRDMLSDDILMEEINMTMSELLEYFSMTEIQE